MNLITTSAGKGKAMPSEKYLGNTAQPRVSRVRFNEPVAYM